MVNNLGKGVREPRNVGGDMIDLGWRGYTRIEVEITIGSRKLKTEIFGTV